MAEKTLNTRQKQKYDTSTNWTTNNPVLLAGELGIESDTNKFKIGNGSSTWNELDYVGGSEIPLYSTTGQNTDGAMTQKAVTDAIPTTLSDLNEDSSHRTVTDTEKATWNSKSDFSGSYNDLTNKPTISTINVGSQPQSTINFDSDPQTQIDNIANNTTKIANSFGGASAGVNAFALGTGGAVGLNATASSGGAIGSGAITGNGFAGGVDAKAVNEYGAGIDAIQLGRGTNTTERTLKIYNDNIYNASTHTLTVQNATVGGAGTSSVGIGNGTITADNNITSKTITATSNLNCDTDNVWFGGGQSENVVDNHAIKTTSSSQTVNNNSNNYVRYNSGLIIQWGHAPINRDNSVRITFSYPFIDANYSIVVLDGDNTDWNNYLNGYRLDGTKAGTDLPLGKSSTQCQIAKRGIANDFDWIAIGRWK